MVLSLNKHVSSNKVLGKRPRQLLPLNLEEELNYSQGNEFRKCLVEEDSYSSELFLSTHDKVSSNKRARKFEQTEGVKITLINCPKPIDDGLSNNSESSSLL